MGARRPDVRSIGFRFETRLPNAKHQSGMGQDTTDFGASILVGKTVQSVRVVGNVGVIIMSSPLDRDAARMTLCSRALSFARAMTSKVEIVGEVNGWASVRAGVAPIGTESRGKLKFGGRFTQGPVRLDAGVFFGLNTIDPTIGFETGMTYVFNAFKVP